MLAGARLQRRRRQLQQPQQSRRRQAFPWPMNADPPPPPWVWMVPGSTGLLRLGAGVAPPPVLLASAQPAAAPLLARLPGWPAPGEPLLPLLPLPSAPDHAVHNYPLLPGQSGSDPASLVGAREPGPNFPQAPGAVQSAVLKSPLRITARQPTIVAAIASKLILLQSPPD
ncbi:Transcription elongation regulator 1-like protein [Microtus ochrogaster]|uniref:Transcription elongation regulator 1-like protein n=1 Tax=Microtus ochrogaster TaxID=79684 RepID=A0A8J6GD15_MICOH|nr:Transcription elongation regulator 1-like protein [Microtus ochrogaster]